MSNPFEVIETRLNIIESLLLDLKHGQTASSAQGDNDRPLNTKEAAEYSKIEIPTLYTLVQKGKIPFHRRGKKLYFFQNELISWIRSGGTSIDITVDDAFLQVNKKRR